MLVGWGAHLKYITGEVRPVRPPHKHTKKQNHTHTNKHTHNNMPFSFSFSFSFFLLKHTHTHTHTNTHTHTHTHTHKTITCAAVKRTLGMRSPVAFTARANTLWSRGLEAPARVRL